MTMDCTWVNKNLEAVLSDDLSAEEGRQARGHIESCEPCRKEVQALIAIDPLIKKYFQAQLNRALSARASGASVLSWRRMAWSGGAVAAVASILFVIVLGSSQVEIGPPKAAVQPQAAPIASVEAPSVIKDDAPAGEERAKPSAHTADAGSIPASSVPEPDANALPFLITDPAGYTRSLEDFRGFTTLIGVWSADQPESIANLERLYQVFGSNPKLRVIGVSNQRRPKPKNTTFPIFYNQGSRLLDAKSGEFILLNEAGTVRMRGSIVKDFDSLSRALQN